MIEVLEAQIAHDIAINKHEIKVFKQIRKAMRGIKYRARHGHFNIKFMNMDKDVGQYLKSIGYSIRSYYDINDDYITVVQWEEVIDAKHD